MKHPPWLRFQAYVVGLPKTGSTSLATIFGNYRCGHETGIADLLRAGLPWAAGDIDEAQFWAMTTPRLTRPSLEMDSVTSHHLYAQLLAQRFPKARFVHSIRDVGGWVTSLLDMILLHRVAAGLIAIEADLVDLEYMRAMTGKDTSVAWMPADQDVDLVPGAMRYWAEHMLRMEQVLPADRSLVVRTGEISDQLPALADLCAVPVSTLRSDLAHANRTTNSLDRLTLYRDHEEIRVAYDEHCAAIMASLFPVEHSRVFTTSLPPGAWQQHCEAVRAQVEQGIRDFRDSRGVTPSTWFRRRS